MGAISFFRGRLPLFLAVFAIRGILPARADLCSGATAGAPLLTIEANESSYLFYKDTSAGEPRRGEYVYHPSQCPLYTVCAVPHLCGEPTGLHPFTVWQCNGLPPSGFDAGDTVADNFEAYGLDHEYACDDASSILVLDRLDGPQSEAGDGSAACVQTSDCFNSPLFNNFTLLGGVSSEGYECLGGRCVSTDDGGATYADFPDLERPHVAFVVGACGTHGLQAFPSMEKYSDDDASDRKRTYNCTGAPTSPDTSDVTTIADACGLCAYDLAHKWSLSAYVSPSSPLSCTVVGRSHVPSDDEINCATYFDDNIFISREGQYEYESLGTYAPAYLLVGQIPADLTRPWRPFMISPPLSTLDGEHYKPHDIEFRKLILDGHINYRGDGNDLLQPPGHTQQYNRPGTPYTRATAPLSNDDPHAGGINGYSDGVFHSLIGKSAGSTQLRPFDFHADYAEGQEEECIWYNMTLNGALDDPYYTIDSHACPFVDTAFTFDKKEQCCGSGQDDDCKTTTAKRGCYRPGNSDYVTDQDRQFYRISGSTGLRFTLAMERTSTTYTNSFGMPGNPFDVTSTIIVNDGPIRITTKTDGLRFPNFYDNHDDDTKKYHFLETCTKRNSSDLLAYKEKEAKSGVLFNNQTFRAIYNRDRINTLAQAYDAEFYTFMVDVKVLSNAAASAENVGYDPNDPGTVTFQLVQPCDRRTAAYSETPGFSAADIDVFSCRDVNNTFTDYTNTKSCDTCHAHDLVSVVVPSIPDVTTIKLKMCFNQPDRIKDPHNMPPLSDTYTKDFLANSSSPTRFMRFRYSNYMNGTHGARGEYYLTETTASVKPGTGNDVRMSMSNTGSNQLCCDGDKTKVCNACSPDCPSFHTDSTSNKCPPFVPTAPVLDVESGLGVADGDGTRIEQAGAQIVNHDPVSGDVSVLNYGLNKWSQKTTCDPPFTLPLGDRNSLDAALGIYRPTATYTSLFTDFVVAPRTFDSAHGLYGTARYSDLSDVDRRLFNDDGANPVGNRCRPLYKRNVYNYAETSFLFYALAQLTGTNDTDSTDGCDATNDDAPYWSGPYVSTCGAGTLHAAGCTNETVTAHFPDGTISELHVYDPYRGANNISINAWRVVQKQKDCQPSDDFPSTNPQLNVYQCQELCASKSKAFSIHAPDGNCKCADFDDCIEPYTSRTDVAVYEWTISHSPATCLILDNARAKAAYPVFSFSQISTYGDLLPPNPTLLESAGIQLLKDYCLRRDAGTLLRSPGGSPYGCTFPPLANETRTPTFGPSICVDADGVRDEDCVYHVTSFFEVPPLLPATPPPATTTTTLPVPAAAFDDAFDDAPDNATCFIDYIEEPLGAVSPAVSEPVASGSRSCRDQCDLEKECGAYRYIQPVCNLYRSPATAPHPIVTGIDDTATFMECANCSECSGNAHVRITAASADFGACAFENVTQMKLNFSGDVPPSFIGAENIEHLEIGDEITSIGASAFSGIGIESLVIPASVTSISSSSFGNLPNLVSADLSRPLNLTLAPNAFSGSNKLHTVLFNGQNHTLFTSRCPQGLVADETARNFYGCASYIAAPASTVFKRPRRPPAPETASDFSIKYDTTRNPLYSYVSLTLYGYDMFSCVRLCQERNPSQSQNQSTAEWTGFTQKCECLLPRQGQSALSFGTSGTKQKGHLLIEFSATNNCDVSTTSTSTAAPTTRAPDNPVAVYGKIVDAFAGLSYCPFSPAWIYPLFRDSSPSIPLRRYNQGANPYYVDPSRPAECTDRRPAGVDATTPTTTTATSTVTTTQFTTPFFTEFTSDDQLVATGIIASVASVAVGLVVVNVCVNRRRARQYGTGTGTGGS